MTRYASESLPKRETTRGWSWLSRKRLFQGLLEDSETIYAYKRILDGQVLTVACNFTDQEQDCVLCEDPTAEELISNYKGHKAGKLQPYEARVILHK